MCYCHKEGGSKKKNILNAGNRLNKEIKILIDKPRLIFITSFFETIWLFLPHCH